MGYAGLPAAFILVLAAGGGFWAAEKFLASDFVDSMRPREMVKLGVVTGVVGLVFWLWATLLTIFREFDLGMVSFALAVVASAYGVGVLPVPLATQTYKVASGVGYGAVFCNYTLGMILVSDVMLRVYFGIGMAFWAAALYAAFANSRDGGLDAAEPTTYSPI